MYHCTSVMKYKFITIKYSMKAIYIKSVMMVWCFYNFLELLFGKCSCQKQINKMWTPLKNRLLTKYH